MSAPVGIAVSTLAEARIAESNDEFLRLLGYRRDEVIGRTSIELGIWPDAKMREELAVETQREGRASREVQLRAKSGELKTIRGATHILEMDGELFLVSAVVDVTDQRRAETELRRSEQLYRTLVEGVRDVIVAMTPEGVLTALNPAFEHVTGMPRSQWIGQSFVGLLVPDDVPLALTLFQAVLRNEMQPITTLRIRTAEGKVRIGEIFLTAHREHDTVVGVLGIARDVTDRVQLEEEYRQAQKMEAVGRLAGGVAHDFNNLLTVIGGHSTFLLEDLDAGDPKRADVEEIMNASTFASTLTRQLLAFSRRQVVQPKVLSLNDVVTASEKLLTRLMGEDVRLVTTLATDAGNVRADAGQLEQTIMNLAVNARDAMPDGGTLTITTANVELNEDRVRGRMDATPGRYVMLAVSDSGVGMDEETKAKIFEPFFTTKEVGKGTGLGLATVFGIVKQSRGLIRVDSEVGRGSRFEIYFPKVDEASESAPPISAKPASGTETVLVVEDELAVRAIVRQTLERSGYHVLEAPNGDDALSIGANHPGQIHLLLTDLVMLGMSGREVAKQLAVLRPGIRILFMSGYSGDSVVAREELERETAYVQKPFTPDDLARTVRRVLDAGPI
jgi:two-component system cell cycle sensor histidine kinase/response regulator CckA